MTASSGDTWGDQGARRAAGPAIRVARRRGRRAGRTGEGCPADTIAVARKAAAGRKD
jgi:hypothetical protein